METECSICLDCISIDNKKKILECSHEFHEICINTMISLTTNNEYFCPLCRQKHTKSNYEINILIGNNTNDNTPIFFYSFRNTLICMCIFGVLFPFLLFLFASLYFKDY